ncbi:hypothetical protein Taro_049851 [Colocasia esculenta]|uniref:BURP domain-containing protein n=1 Tax=Colocasia esculenta TaxID=4460 RepID=A0A843XC74_COLES|nr:hypothetical protein [Colocasia esculenta]
MSWVSSPCKWALSTHAGRTGCCRLTWATELLAADSRMQSSFLPTHIEMRLYEASVNEHILISIFANTGYAFVCRRFLRHLAGASNGAPPLGEAMPSLATPASGEEGQEGSQGRHRRKKGFSKAEEPFSPLLSSTNEDVTEMKRKLHFSRRTPEATFIPLLVIDAFPFSTEKLPEIMTLFSMKTDSKEAEDLKKTLLPCDTVDPGEAQLCATSLESMVDFTISSLWTCSSLVAEGENVIACHVQPYPYAIFFCHAGAGATKLYKVKLVGEDGSRATAIAICHTKPSGWNPKHMAFQVLKVKPGTTICHFLQ